MIKLTFNFNREIMNFFIDKKEVYYQDRLWLSKIRCIPKDEQFIQKIRDSRNRYSPKLIEMFSLSKQAQEEYDNAKDEKELAEITIRDCKKKGIKLIKIEEEKDGLKSDT